jgi:hypothetical protein
MLKGSYCTNSITKGLFSVQKLIANKFHYSSKQITGDECPFCLQAYTNFCMFSFCQS